MAWVAVGKYGEEYICSNRMIREAGFWIDSKPIEDYYDTSFGLPKGSIKKLIGRDLTFEDDCVEIKVKRV